jgi:hypothetical protein
LLVEAAVVVRVVAVVPAVYARQYLQPVVAVRWNLL